MPNVPFEREHASAYLTELIGHFVGLSESTAGRITDFNDGSNIKSFLATIALRLEHLDSKVFLGLQRAIPTILYEFFGPGDGVSTDAGFPALPALYASGVVRFQRFPGYVGNIEIPAGSRLYVPDTTGATPEKPFVTIGDAVIPDGGTYVDTLVRAVYPGAFSNTHANTIDFRDLGPVATPTAGIHGATNPAAILNGADAETDESRRRRFVRYLRNLARCQLAGLEVGALTAHLVTAGVVTEQALYARAVPVPEKRGLVDVFIDNGGGNASAALAARAQVILDGSVTEDGTRVAGYKTAGIDVRARAVFQQVVNVSVKVALDPGFILSDVRDEIVDAVEGYLFGLGVFADLIRADLLCAVNDIRGVADVEIVSPTTNVSTLAGARIMAGTVTVAGL